MSSFRLWTFLLLHLSMAKVFAGISPKVYNPSPGDPLSCRVVQSCTDPNQTHLNLLIKFFLITWKSGMADFKLCTVLLGQPAPGQDRNWDEQEMNYIHFSGYSSSQSWRPPNSTHLDVSIIWHKKISGHEVSTNKLMSQLARHAKYADVSVLQDQGWETLL